MSLGPYDPPRKPATLSEVPGLRTEPATSGIAGNAAHRHVLDGNSGLRGGVNCAQGANRAALARLEERRALYRQIRRLRRFAGNGTDSAAGRWRASA